MSEEAGQKELPDRGTGRIEALSDGVFAIALTLLIIDVVAVAKKVEPGRGLSEHLLHEWPTLVAYLVGFLTILVCWINHHFVFDFVRRSDSGLVWVNGLQLMFVSAVPLPTALLAEHVQGDDRRAALVIYGVTFFLIATSFWVLWLYVTRRGLADRAADPARFGGVATIYGLSVAWTILCVVVASFSVWPALAMWAVMFAVFAFPAAFAGVAAARRTAVAG